MNRFFKFFLLCICLSPAVNEIHAKSKLVRILILSGNNNHDWKTTTPFIQSVFAGDRQFTADVTERPDTLSVGMLKSYQVIVSNWNAFPDQTGLWTEEAKKAVLDFMDNGGGFVCIHAASATHQDWREYLQITGGRWGDKTHHGAMHTFNVHICQPNHPVVKGMKDFDIRDELWVDMECDPNMEVLCTAKAEEYKDLPDKTEPVALVTRYGKGRGFYLVLGHDADVMKNRDWQILLLRGTAWVGGIRSNEQ
jgi:type 1 glutamine amidotransferase